MTDETRTTRTIFTAFTDDEVQAREAELGKLAVRRHRIEKQKSAALSEWRTRTKEIKAAVEEAAAELDAGGVREDVEVLAVPDVEHGRMLYLDPDTRRQLDERALTPEELEDYRQADLDFDGGDDELPVSAIEPEPSEAAAQH